MACTIDGCDNTTRGAKGFCGAHYKRLRLHGDPMRGGSLERPTAPELFHTRYVTDDITGCMVWIGSRDRHGYGKFGANNRMAHRWSHEHFVGPVNPGLCVCHRCDNPPCVNPDHLFLGTNGDNIADRHAKGRTARRSLNGRAKLSESNVTEIRSLSGAVSQRALAARFGVSQTAISRIVSGQSWIEASLPSGDR